ncbi:tetratricopeptide repeat protein [Tropicibacter naphthalenivorans]|uniref:Putative PEP-CTERM system TPR-repeat lipoprotein n=1 Tax=Tropicibacter naphthalenivorans TaxID=441103 RepID=A0A0P1GKW5_9RHOB|nr:tetratricopeptide repeat protein [Tropicibacter naphthalenivorans]CUH82611.1 putative PEP-CTERM system TPR-repeat lipoprotein [Tropicibacter naphthalenivorans]SMD08844.1 Methyltransferase domain-containing protein [Tropicibacter naphthalenivorans]
MAKNDMPDDLLVDAKQAIQRSDWPEAHDLLTQLLAQRPSGVVRFFLARVQHEQGKPDEALGMLAPFLEKNPDHAGGHLLQGRIFLALDDLDAAEAAVLRAIELNPELTPATRLLDQIRQERVMIQARQFIAVVDADYLAARDTGPSEALIAAAQGLADLPPGPNWNNDTEQAKIAYFHFAPDLKQALRNYDPHLIDVSTRFDYITWPKRIQDHVRGKSVIDVGCGFGGYGMGFLVAGAVDYAGLDPVMKLDSTRAKNKRTRTWSDMGVTPREVADALPAIRLFECIAEDMPVEETFDTVALHNVTEHLIQLDLVFSGLVKLCKPDTRVIYLHHNFFCWNGHHFAPNQPHQLDLDNPKHLEVYDWRHIDLHAAGLPDDHYFTTHLNQIRLDEIRAITEKYFDIEVWDEIPSSQATLERLTPEILDRVRQSVPDLTERELKTNVVFCIARPKALAEG